MKKICQGYVRVNGVVLHAKGCPVLMADGDPTRVTHGLTPECAAFYGRSTPVQEEARVA